MQSISRRSPVGTPAPAGKRSEHRLGAIGVAPLHPGNSLTGWVSGDVFDVSQMNAVNSAESGERVLAAQMKYEHGLGLGVLLVVGEGGLDQKLFTIVSGRRVATLADLPRRAQILHRGWDWSGIVGDILRSEMRQWMEGDFNKLLGSVHLGAKVSFGARANVTVDAGHMGMWGNLVGREFRMHYVAGLATELGRIHVGGTAIGGDGHNQQIDNGGHQHDVEAVTKDAVVEIDLGELDRNLSGLLELSAAEKDAYRDKKQTEYEQSRKEQEKDDAKIGISVGSAYNLDQPIADHGDAGGAGDGAACKTYGVVAEE